MRVFTRWDQAWTTDETNHFVTELALWHVSQIQFAETERQYITACLTSGDYRLLCNLNLAYEKLQPLDAYHIRQCIAFFKKRSDIELGIDREAVAFEKFKASELLCKQTNEIFKSWSAGRFQFRPAVEAVLHSVQRKVDQILGDVPEFAELKPRFGPGATTQVKKRDAHALRKLSETFACSEDFLPVLQMALEDLGGWVFGHSTEHDTALASVVIHNGVLDFVLKNFEEHRTIGKEPSLNMMYQLAHGQYIAQRLKKFGVDVTDQTKNQILARLGSITGALATSDLTSASDCVATMFVQHCLTDQWFTRLSYLRTGVYEYKGNLLKLQKFSSMGNGFTFPLETLLFYAITESVCELVLKRKIRPMEIAVFGDDIICPTECYEFLHEVLHAVGFIPNCKKSFASGPFRESCGKDYVSGIDIRPAFIDGPLSCADAFILHNYYVRTMQQEAADLVLAVISKPVRLFGPDGYGDGHLLGDWQPVPVHRTGKEIPKKRHEFDVPRDWRSTRYCSGHGGYTFDTYTWKPRRSYRPLPGDCVLPSYSVYVSPPQECMHSVEFRSKIRSPHLRRPTLLRSDYGFNAAAATVSGWDKQGKLGCVLPGTKGYKRISIYTLSVT